MQVLKASFSSLLVDLQSLEFREIFDGGSEKEIERGRKLRGGRTMSMTESTLEESSQLMHTNFLLDYIILFKFLLSHKILF